MNRRKKSTLNRWTIFCILIATVLTSLGGVHYANLKNQQTLVLREKVRVEGQIQVCQRQTQELQIRIDQALNRYTIREQLVMRNSRLKTIAADRLENVMVDQPQNAVALAP